MSFDCCSCLKCFFSCGYYPCTPPPVHPTAPESPHTRISNPSSVPSPRVHTPRAPMQSPRDSLENARRRYEVIFKSENDRDEAIDHAENPQMTATASRIGGTIAIRATGPGALPFAIPVLRLELLVHPFGAPAPAADDPDSNSEAEMPPVHLSSPSEVHPHAIVRDPTTPLNTERDVATNTERKERVDTPSPIERLPIEISTSLEPLIADSSPPSASPDSSPTSAHSEASLKREAEGLLAVLTPLRHLPVPLRPTLVPISNPPPLPPLSLASVSSVRLGLAYPHLPLGAAVSNSSSST